MMVCVCMPGKCKCYNYDGVCVCLQAVPDTGPGSKGQPTECPRRPEAAGGAVSTAGRGEEGPGGENQKENSGGCLLEAYG